MSVLKIVTVDEEGHGLRRDAAPVSRIDSRIRRLLDDMVDTMRDAPGVGLAAPQVGVDMRMIVVEVPIDDEDPDAGMRLHALVSPQISDHSEDLEEGQEACLSIPGLYGDVPRYQSITIDAMDGDGNQVEVKCTGFEARVFQHEIDHLDGILFTDRVTGFDKLYTLKEDEDGDFVKVPYNPGFALSDR